MSKLTLCLLLTSLTGSAAWSGNFQPTSSRTTSISEGTTGIQSRQDFFRTFIQSTVATGTAFVVLGGGLQQPPNAYAAADFNNDEGPVVKISDPVGTVVNLPNGVTYTVIKAGTGPVPSRGELVAIRFSAYCGDIKIDDIFDTPEPYYSRMGSGALIKGVEETLPLMQVGDRWKLIVPGNLAFGKKGRPSSAGKPRIPADATIVFEVEMVGLPGKEVELIELIGDY